MAYLRKHLGLDRPAEVPTWAFDAPISDRAFRVYAILCWLVDRGRMFSEDRVADSLGCRADDVSDALAELDGIGAMRVIEADGGRITYKLLNPVEAGGGA